MTSVCVCTCMSLSRSLLTPSPFACFVLFRVIVGIFERAALLLAHSEKKSVWRKIIVSNSRCVFGWAFHTTRDDSCDVGAGREPNYHQLMLFSVSFWEKHIYVIYSELYDKTYWNNVVKQTSVELYARKSLLITWSHDGGGPFIAHLLEKRHSVSYWFYLIIVHPKTKFCHELLIR